MAELAIVFDKNTGLYKAQLIGTSQIASGAITADKIYDGDPFTIQQTSAPQMRHVPYGSDYGAGPTYNPVHVDASGYQYFAAVWPDNTVTSSKIASGQVGMPHIYPGAVISAKIASGIVGTPHLRDLNVTSAKLAAAIIGLLGAVADEAITSAKLASGAVIGDRVAVDGIVSSHIGANVIGGIHILAGAIVSAKIGANAIGTPHLEQFASGKIIVGQGTGTNPILKDQLGAIGFIIDGGDSVITSGQKGHLEIPFPVTLDRVTLLADQSGYITVNIWKDSYANFPPTSGDTICAAARPLISSSFKYQDTALTGWTKSIVSGDILAYGTDIASNIQRCTVSLGAYK